MCLNPSSLPSHPRFCLRLKATFPHAPFPTWNLRAEDL